MAPIVSPYVYLILPSIPKEDIKLFLYVEVLILEWGTLHYIVLYQVVSEQPYEKILVLF